MIAYTNPNAVPLQKLNIFLFCVYNRTSVVVQSMFVYKKDIEFQVRAMHVQFVVIAYTYFNIIPFQYIYIRALLRSSSFILFY